MIKALLFDLNGTLINILTNEGDDNVYRVTANFLSYRGVYLAPEVLKNLFYPNVCLQDNLILKQDFQTFYHLLNW